MKRPEKVDRKYIIAAAIIALIGVIVAVITSSVERNSYAAVQYRAAERMMEAEAYMKEEILSLGIEIDPEDINKTGLLGPEFTELTTTPGSPDAKRTSLDPNFAAAMVRYFHEAGLEKGDTIAIGSSGSFPGLLIAALCAGTEMDLDIRLINSLGASMHGGTRPDYNVFDILHALLDGGFADFDVLAVSPGGNDDLGGSCLEDVIYFGTRDLSRQLCEESGWPVLEHKDMADNIMERFELYGDGIKLFINIGGASPNCGTSSYTLNFPQGLVLDPPTIPLTPYRGLNYEYAARGVPVLNLLNVKLLASENGIAYDPVPLSKPGESGVYTVTHYSLPIMIAFIVLALSVLVVGYAKRKKAE